MWYWGFLGGNIFAYQLNLSVLISLYFLEAVFVVCVFLKIFPLYLDYLVCYHINCSQYSFIIFIFINSVAIYHISCLILVMWIFFFQFFNLDIGLSVLLIFSKNYPWLYWFSWSFFYSRFLYIEIFITSFPLYILC